MNNRNLIVYGFITFVVFIVVYLIYLAFFQKNPEKKASSIIPTVTAFPTFLPSPTIFRSGYSDKIKASGVVMDNFHRTAFKIRSNGNVIISQNRDCQLVYLGPGDFFILSINNSPFYEVKARVEKEFLRILNITQAEACRMRVSIVTPRFANPDYAGHEYQFSFCQ